MTRTPSGAGPDDVLGLSLDDIGSLARALLGDGDAADRERVGVLARDEAVAPLIIANRLGALVVRAMRSAGAAVPSPALALDARETVTRALAALATLKELAAAFADAGLPWLLWKGPAVSVAAWDDPAMRRSSDLDLVVRRGERERAADILIASGWRPRHGMSRRQQRWVQGGTGAWDFERDAAGPFIELHWRFASGRFPRGLDAGEVLDRAVRLSLPSVEIPVAAPADAILLHALHATKHGWSQLEDAVTYARLVDRSPEALAEARRRARALGWGGAIELAEELRAAVVARHPSVAPSSRASACIERMQRGDGAWRAGHAWSRAWMDRRRDRLRYWPHALLAPTLEEWKWVRLPDALCWLYPAVRLVRLAVRR